MSYPVSLGGGLAMLSFGIFGSVSVAAEAPSPVVVELFTSEGCSSCPPGENALSILEKEAKSGNNSVIVLEWHVDYWDYLGWKDRFGSAEATQRQYQYARSLPSSVYTPQMVINGNVVPSYAGDWEQATYLVQHAQPSSAHIEVRIAEPARPDAVELEVRSRGVPPSASVLAVLVESGLSSKPTAGENAGRNLVHTQVVRRSQLLGGIQGTFRFATPGTVDRSRATIVLLVQDQRSMAILASCQVAFPRVAVSMRGQWKGKVVDRSGVGLSNAPLQACSDQVCVPGTTDSQGNFVFEALLPGKYSLTVGSRSHVAKIDLAGGQVFDEAKAIVVQ